MKLIWTSCAACGAEWEAVDRSIPPFCPTCGSERTEKLLFGGQKRVSDMTRVPREERIVGLGFIMGLDALRSAKESGDWDLREGEGGDPNDLEAEYWLAHHRSKLVATLGKEGLLLDEKEENAAAEAFRRGWDWAIGPTPSGR